MENLTMNAAKYIDNEMRLLEIEAENNVLLHRIKRLETKINRAKQHFQQPNKRDITMLNSMVSKSLHLLAEKDTLIIVGNSPVTQRVLHGLIRSRHQYLTQKFKTRLYYKQFERPVYRLCHL